MVTSIGLRSARRATRGRHLRRGAVAVEMAVVTPLLLMLLFGIIEFGWVFMIQETITNATREAARVGVLQGATHADIQARFGQAMAPTGIKVDSSMLTIQDATEANPVVTISVAIPYSQVSLAGQWLGLNINRTIGSSCSMRREG